MIELQLLTGSTKKGTVMDCLCREKRLKLVERTRSRKLQAQDHDPTFDLHPAINTYHLC